MKKDKTMKYITVLDFENGSVFRYNIQGKVLLTKHKGTWYPESESCAEFLGDVGHNLSNCEWMVHDSAEIYTQTNEGDVVITN